MPEDFYTATFYRYGTSLHSIKWPKLNDATSHLKGIERDFLTTKNR